MFSVHQNILCRKIFNVQNFTNRRLLSEKYSKWKIAKISSIIRIVLMSLNELFNYFSLMKSFQHRWQKSRTGFFYFLFLKSFCRERERVHKVIFLIATIVCIFHAICCLFKDWTYLIIWRSQHFIKGEYIRSSWY